MTAASTLNKTILKECDRHFGLLEQPGFHENNKSASEKFCSCCAGGQTTAISRNELRNYKTFCNIFIHRYDDKNPEHESVLKALFDLVFPETDPAREQANMVNLHNERWKDVGF